MVGDIKDTAGESKKTGQLLDPVARFPAVFQNDHHAYAARKAERLAAAVHLVTSFADPGEPLRLRLRNAALDLVVLALNRSRLIEAGPQGFGARAAELAALVATAESASLVSQMNAALIVDEYARLAEFVKERYAFINLQVADLGVLQTIGHQETGKGQKDTDLYKTQNKDIVKVTSETSTRKSDILALFTNREWISIKDAVLAIPGVSEKTLQRDLLALVAQGVLVKEGERRWSIYKKAPQSAE